MKAILIGILILTFSFSVQAGEEHNKTTTYSADTIKALKIDSLESLVKNHFTSNNHEKQTAGNILYLVNGERSEMSAQEKDSAILAATSVEVLGDYKALVINVLL